eukprot:scaffold79504_cov27-Tisochrysis_lutea.AAC.3
MLATAGPSCPTSRFKCSMPVRVVPVEIVCEAGTSATGTELASVAPSLCVGASGAVGASGGTVAASKSSRTRDGTSCEPSNLPR